MFWDWDLGTDVFVDGIDVVFELSRDGNDGSVSSDGSYSFERDG